MSEDVTLKDVLTAIEHLGAELKGEIKAVETRLEEKMDCGFQELRQDFLKELRSVTEQIVDLEADQASITRRLQEQERAVWRLQKKSSTAE